MNNDRKMNNSCWIIEEYTDWLDNSIKELDKLYKQTSTKDEQLRLYHKVLDLRTCKAKFEELKYN